MGTMTTARQVAGRIRFNKYDTGPFRNETTSGVPFKRKLENTDTSVEFERWGKKLHINIELVRRYEKSTAHLSGYIELDAEQVEILRLLLNGNKIAARKLLDKQMSGEEAGRMSTMTAKQ